MIILGKNEVDMNTETRVYNLFALPTILYTNDSWAPLKKLITNTRDRHEITRKTRIDLE